jgi:hypothetical protein
MTGAQSFRLCHRLLNKIQEVFVDKKVQTFLLKNASKIDTSANLSYRSGFFQTKTSVTTGTASQDRKF